MRPEIAAKVGKSIGNFTAAKGADELMDPRLKAQFAESFPEGAEEHQVVSGGPAGHRGDRGRRARSRQGRQLSSRRRPPASAPADLEATRVSKRFGAHLAVDDLSFAVARGSFFSILGPSGCGKTTLLRMIAGFIQPDGGEHRHRRPRHGRRRRPTAARSTWCSSSWRCFPMMSVGENVAFGLARRGVARAERVRKAEAMLERVGLAGAGGKRIDELSGGQRQRVAIARSLVLEPTLLLLDEPLGALDLKLREHMKIELKQLQAAFGTTFVYITHDQSEALVLSDHVGGDEPRPLRAARHAAGAVLRPGDAVRGRLRRRQQPRRRQGAGASRVRWCRSELRPAGACGRARTAAIAVGSAVEAFIRPEAAMLGRSAADFPPGQLALYRRGR